MHKQIKQNPKTNQMKPKQFKWNPIKPTAKHTHTTQPRERSQEEKRVWEIGVKTFWPMMADREVRDGGGGDRFSEKRWESILWAAMAIGSWSGGGVDERQRWRRGVESEGLFKSPEKRVIDLSFSWEIWASVESEGFFVLESELQSCLMFGFSFFLLCFLFFYLY